MHIVRNGIDVPDELVRAHEEGRVVFFCGSGISCEAGLSNFEDLTYDVFRRVGERMNPAEEAAAGQGRWDAVLGSLENRIADRTQMRRKLLDALTPDVAKPNFSVATHEALLDLSFVNDDDPHLQLVTTNFDLLFEPLIGERCGFFIAIRHHFCRHRERDCGMVSSICMVSFQINMIGLNYRI